MPTILRINGFRFFFYSNENDEPAHVHVEKGDAEGKIWLEPTLEAVYFVGFSSAELNDIMDIASSNLKNFIKNGMSTLANNQYDPIENLIFTEGLRIEALDFHPDQDLMLIILNTKVVLTQNLSSYGFLKTADKSQLLQYELIGRGTGVHWTSLDEDLSLKGFLKNELRKVVKTDKGSVAA
jgi:hypothetical protein